MKLNSICVAATLLSLVGCLHLQNCITGVACTAGTQRVTDAASSLFPPPAALCFRIQCGCSNADVHARCDHTQGGGLPSVEDFHIDPRPCSVLDQSVGVLWVHGSDIDIGGSQYPPPNPTTEGSEVTECPEAVWPVNGTLKGFAVFLEDNEWSHMEDQTGSH